MSAELFRKLATVESLRGAVAALLDARPEVVISWARLLLAVGSCFSVALYETGSVSSIMLGVGLGYSAFAAMDIIVTLLVRVPPVWAPYTAHGIDVAFSAAMLLLTPVITSPFFVFPQFVLIAATLRWNWRGAIATAIILTFVTWLLFTFSIAPRADVGAHSPDENPALGFMRSGFFIVSGGMLAYMGAYRERARRRFAQLAAWPAAVYSASSHRELLEILLSYSASILNASRLLVIWDEREEPDRHLAFWTSDGLDYKNVQPTLFGSLVATGHEARAFAYPKVLRLKNRSEEGGGSDLLIHDLVQAYEITTALTAPFKTARCRGRLFVLDGITSEENLPLTCLIASRIGASLEARILRQKLETTAALDERAKLSRDLHDGVLQGLAAANLHLKVVSASLPPALQEQLQTVRLTLTDEAQRIRNFVEANRATALSPSSVVPLTPDIEQRVARLRDLWGCMIHLKVDPPALSASLKAVRSLGHILAECVSNSVRHGNASRIEISVLGAAEKLLVSVSDNGFGCKDLQGSYTASELVQKKAGPLSLMDRVADAEGTLTLETSSEGTTIRLELSTW